MTIASNRLIQTAFWIVFYVAIGWLIGNATQDGVRIWYPTLEKPPLQPPNLAFPIVWTSLYVLMGISAQRLVATRALPGGKICLGLFAVQSVMNWLWSFIFFEWHLLGMAFGWIIVMIALTALLTLKSRSHAPVVSVLLIPYLLWISFACYLSGSIWLLN